MSIYKIAFDLRPLRCGNRVVEKKYSLAPMRAIIRFFRWLAFVSLYRERDWNEAGQMFGSSRVKRETAKACIVDKIRANSTMVKRSERLKLRVSENLKHRGLEFLINFRKARSLRGG